MYRKPAVSWTVKNNSSNDATVGPDSSCANAAATTRKPQAVIPPLATK